MSNMREMIHIGDASAKKMVATAEMKATATKTIITNSYITLMHDYSQPSTCVQTLHDHLTIA